MRSRWVRYLIFALAVGSLLGVTKEVKLATVVSKVPRAGLVEGEGVFEGSGSPSPITVLPGKDFEEGDVFVATQDNTVVYLDSKLRSFVRLKGGTKIIFLRGDDNQITNIALGEGKAEFHIDGGSSTGGVKFTVITPHLVLGVRGTNFIVKITPDKSIVRNTSLSVNHKIVLGFLKDDLLTEINSYSPSSYSTTELNNYKFDPSAKLVYDDGSGPSFHHIYTFSPVDVKFFKLNSKNFRFIDSSSCPCTCVSSASGVCSSCAPSCCSNYRYYGASSWVLSAALSPGITSCSNIASQIEIVRPLTIYFGGTLPSPIYCLFCSCYGCGSPSSCSCSPVSSYTYPSFPELDREEECEYDFKNKKALYKTLFAVVSPFSPAVLGNYRRKVRMRGAHLVSKAEKEIKKMIGP